MPAFAASKYEHVLISDSNVSVCRDYLKETVKHMADPHVGLVTNPIRGVGGRTMGSVLENLHLNSFVIGSVCFLDSFLKMPCVIGKSMLMRKSDLEAIGGLRSVKDVLAEDYIIGREMHRSGKRVVLADHVIHNVNEYWGTRKFLNRHTRWGKLRWKIGGARYLAELVANPVFLSLMPLVLLGPASDTLTLALLVGLLKIVGDCHVGKKIGSKMNPLCYLLVPVKDALIGLLWLAPLVSNTIVWRGNRYLIEKDSRLQPYPDDSIWGIRFRVLDAIKARFA
jgi:ceramide glucosyltransferase